MCGGYIKQSQGNYLKKKKRISKYLQSTLKKAQDKSQEGATKEKAIQDISGIAYRDLHFIHFFLFSYTNYVYSCKNTDLDSSSSQRSY